MHNVEIQKETMAQRIAREVVEELMPETVRSPISSEVVSSTRPVVVEVIDG